MRASVLGAALVLAGPAQAQLGPAELARVMVRPPPGASLPTDVAVRDADTGRAMAFADIGRGRPRVLVFADYACTTLCGPALAITGQRLAEAGSRGENATLAVVGLAPDSRATTARGFADARLPPAVRVHTAVLTAGAPALLRLTSALGYHYVWDPQARTFAHPVAAFVLAPDGRLVRTLSEVALTGQALADALDDAQVGRTAPSLLQEVALVCHGALQALGRFDGAALVALRAGALATLLAMVGGLAWLLRRRGGRAA